MALCSNCPIEKNGMRMEAYVPNREEKNMKICPNCHAVQQDHRTACVDCGERLGAPVSAKEEKRLRGDMDAQMEKLYNQKDPLYTTKLDKTAGFGILLTMLAVLVLTFFLSDENRWYLVLVGLVFTLIGTAEAFFPKIGWELEKLRLSFSVNGTDVFWLDSGVIGDADGNKTTDLAAGRYYTFNINVPQADGDSPRIQWVKGITPPNDDEWLKYPNRTSWYLPYNEKYGWIDCNKAFASNGNLYDLADGNMCWAASASSILHWWINQNHDYIERYKKILERRGETFNAPSAQFPSENFLSGKQKQESDILQHFTNSFLNYAGYGEYAIN